MTEHDEVMQRRVDWGLSEVVAGQTAPDVTAAVRARLQDDATRESARSPRRPWLAAAVLLLGVGAVGSVVYWQQRNTTPNVADAPPDDTPDTPPQDPLPVVTSRAAIDGLPSDLLAVELRNQDDAALRALVARCPQLRHLRVVASSTTRRSGDPDEPVSITDASLATLAQLPKLRRLELEGTSGIAGHGLRWLADLPLLEALHLRHFDVDDDALAVLPRLASLRELDLTLNHGFGWPTAADPVGPGMRAIVACPGLRRLSLGGCSQLSTDALLALHDLKQLRDLDLSSLTNSYRGYSSPSARDRSVANMNRLIESQGQFPKGVTDAALGAWPLLRRLSLGNNPTLTTAIGRLLRDRCPRLVELDLSDCPNVGDATLLALREINSLRRLNLARCAGLTATAGGTLQAMGIAEVDLRELAWVDLPLAERLFRRGVAVTASRTADPSFNAAFAALAARYPRSPNLRPELVRTVAEIDALPPDITAIEVRDLGDPALPALLRRPTLEQLEFVSANAADALSDAGLAQVAELRKLQSLRLLLNGQVSAAALRPLQQLPNLSTLELNVRADAALVELLPQFPQLTDLTIVFTHLPAASLAEVTRCRKLRRLRVAGARQADAATLAALGRLTELRTLELDGVAGITDAALAGWHELTKLEVLRIPGGEVTATGLAALSAMSNLRVLDLADQSRLDNRALAALPESLTLLRLDRAADLTIGAGKLLRQRLPKLTRLYLSGATWLDDDDLRALLTLPELDTLGLMDCRGPTSAVIADVIACRSLRDLDATRCAWLDDAAAQRLRAARPELGVTRKVW